jgi:hypothetical protein
MEQISPETCFDVNKNDPVQLEKAGQLFRYDPGNLKHVWSRRQLGQQRYSIAGLMHTNSTDSAMELLSP